jgi:hypothetical protein
MTASWRDWHSAPAGKYGSFKCTLASDSQFVNQSSRSRLMGAHAPVYAADAFVAEMGDGVEGFAF